MPFDDPRLLRRFFLLPDELYRAAHMLHDETPGRRAKKHPVRAAQIHEQALMLDLLQRDPMRRYNLASINVEEDFIRDEKGRIIKLWMSGERTKNGIELDMPISPDLEKRIRTHLTKYRPLLQGATSPWLFPSPAGAHRAPDNVTKSLGRVVRKALGVRFTPHMMRHILATVLYRRDPQNGVVVQRKLRHSSVKITEQMYGRMSNAGANGAWQREVERYRRIDITRKSSKKRHR
jgi:integrase